MEKESQVVKNVGTGPSTRPCRETASIRLLCIADDMQQRGERFIKRAEGIRAFVNSLTPEQSEGGSQIEEALYTICNAVQGMNRRRNW